MGRVRETPRVMAALSEAGRSPPTPAPSPVPTTACAHPAPATVKDVGRAVRPLPPRLATAFQGAVLQQARQIVAARTVVAPMTTEPPTGRAPALTSTPEPPAPGSRRRATGGRREGRVNVVLGRVAPLFRAPRHGVPAIKVTLTAAHPLPARVRVGPPRPPPYDLSSFRCLSLPTHAAHTWLLSCMAGDGHRSLLFSS